MQWNSRESPETNPHNCSPLVHGKEAKASQGRQDNLSDTTWESYTKTQIPDNGCKTQNYRTPEGNKGENLSGFADYSLDIRVTWSLKKFFISWISLILKKNLPAKDNAKRMKRQINRIGENVYKRHRLYIHIKLW